MVNPNFWATLERAESMGILSDEGLSNRIAIGKVRILRGIKYPMTTM